MIPNYKGVCLVGFTHYFDEINFKTHVIDITWTERTTITSSPVALHAIRSNTERVLLLLDGNKADNLT